MISIKSLHFQLLFTGNAMSIIKNSIFLVQLVAWEEEGQEKE